MNQNRKSKNRDVLNSIRLTMLDWDPMDLFSLGQAGLEEYDEYIPEISSAIKSMRSATDIEAYLQKLATDQMEKTPDPTLTAAAAEKLFRLGLS